MMITFCKVREDIGLQHNTRYNKYTIIILIINQLIICYITR